MHYLTLFCFEIDKSLQSIFYLLHIVNFNSNFKVGEIADIQIQLRHRGNRPRFVDLCVFCIGCLNFKIKTFKVRSVYIYISLSFIFWKINATRPCFLFILVTHTCQILFQGIKCNHGMGLKIKYTHMYIFRHLFTCQKP